MITENFQIFQGIGKKLEEKLKHANINNWDDVLNKTKPACISSQIWIRLQDQIRNFVNLMETNEFSLLANKIPGEHHWQLIPNFIGKIAYLDIETTGLSWHSSHITTIAVYDGEKVYDFVRYQNLDDFPDFISKYPVITTFYGKGFDVPFIQNEMNIKLEQIHYDLCFLLRKIGLRGGLKNIEQKLGISRPESAGIDGFLAVKLWRKYRKTQDSRYLETLLAYNNEDVINLEYLLHFVFNEYRNMHKSSLLPLEYVPKQINIPYRAHRDILSEFLF